MFPKARRNAITARDVGPELLLYDHELTKVHCLNQVSAAIWKCCDGKTSVDHLIRLVQERLGIADAAPMVELALDQLRRRQLLEPDAKPAPLLLAARVSRREALKRLVAAAIALPVIATMTPKALAASIVSKRHGCPSGTVQCGASVVGHHHHERIRCCDANEVCNGGNCVPRPPPQAPPPPPPPPQEEEG